jgi:hypothetical protein
MNNIKAEIENIETRQKIIDEFNTFIDAGFGPKGCLSKTNKNGTTNFINLRLDEQTELLCLILKFKRRREDELEPLLHRINHYDRILQRELDRDKKPD